MKRKNAQWRYKNIFNPLTQHKSPCRQRFLKGHCRAASSRAPTATQDKVHTAGHSSNHRAAEPPPSTHGCFECSQATIFIYINTITYSDPKRCDLTQDWKVTLRFWLQFCSHLPSQDDASHTTATIQIKSRSAKTLRNLINAEVHWTSRVKEITSPNFKRCWAAVESINIHRNNSCSGALNISFLKTAQMYNTSKADLHMN